MGSLLACSTPHLQLFAGCRDSEHSVAAHVKQLVGHGEADAERLVHRCIHHAGALHGAGFERQQAARTGGARGLKPKQVASLHPWAMEGGSLLGKLGQGQSGPYVCVTLAARRCRLARGTAWLDHRLTLALSTKKRLFHFPLLLPVYTKTIKWGRALRLPFAHRLARRAKPGQLRQVGVH